MKRIRIGCSGWNYRHWRGLFYPEGLPQRRWFEFYAENFDTVEINNSFYRLPKAETFEKWRDQAPPGFCYAVKANRYLTQARKLKECEEPLQRMMTPLRALGDRLGPILYQLPPRFRINLERLDSFLKLLPADVASVFEFRHPSWHVPETLALLDRFGAGFCVHDMAGSATERTATGKVAYVRFHGGTGKYHGRYRDDVLLSWTDWLRGQARRAGGLVLFQQRHRSARRRRRSDIEGHGRAGGAMSASERIRVGSSGACRLGPCSLSDLRPQPVEVEG